MLGGALSYIRETVQGKTKPNRVTWLLWSIAPLIGSAAAFSDGVRLATLPVLITGVVPLIVLVASFVNKESYWKLEKTDYVCGLFSVLALVLWRVTDDPVVAITFAIVSDALAALPTVVKSWRFPETESIEVYVTAIFGNATSFFVLKTGDFSEIAFPIYLVSINLLIFFALYRKRFIKRNQYSAMNLPEEMRRVAREIAAQPGQEAALHFSYDVLTKKYRGYRSLTFLRSHRLFITDIATLWSTRGFLHCHQINCLLQTLLIASGHFTAEDITPHWTFVWYLTPHQYLSVRLRSGEVVNVDVWARVYGVPFGQYAHGFQSGSFFAKMGT